MSQQLSLEQFLGNNDAVIIDVRTPAEYAIGHIPTASNMPLFSNEERAEVGTLYKQVSREAAVLRGLEIVGPKLAYFVRKATKLAKGREIYLYCWRGGMRSGSMAWLLSTAGLSVSLLKGGYKAYRARFDEVVALPWQFVVVYGKTGCGKTDVLKQLEAQGEQVLDLEGLANHKGSAFGGMGLGEQPSTESFINFIHNKLCTLSTDRIVWCEGESMLIGHVYIPQNLFHKLVASPIVVLDLDMECRIARLVTEYGAFDNELLIPTFERIRKRLGFDNTKEAIEALQVGDVATAARIALRYYDKGYSMATDKRTGMRLGTVYMESDTPDTAATKLKELVYNTLT